jgi:UDP-N-acetylmuramate dehydrogenase
MQIEENKPLAPLTTFGIGGPARWYVRATTEAEIVEATAWARERMVPLFVLGGGSNILISDSGFPGLVLHTVLKGIAAVKVGQTWLYRVAAGEDWDQFVRRAVDDQCAGIECLAGIPGTVGGTPVQNVGAYGQEVSSTIAAVRVFDLREGVFRLFANKECGFAYRRSRFNTEDHGRYLVTRVKYRLTRGGAPEIKYTELKGALNALTPPGVQPSLAETSTAVRRLRFNKGMLLVEGEPDCRSAGSFFKNPVVTAEQLGQIREVASQSPPQFPTEPADDNEPRIKVPAAWLIEQSGFHKGYRLGAAGISSRHTLALVNVGGATAQEILALAARITEGVEARFGIRLDREPVLVGFD